MVCGSDPKSLCLEVTQKLRLGVTLVPPARHVAITREATPDDTPRKVHSNDTQPCPEETLSRMLSPYVLEARTSIAKAIRGITYVLLTTLAAVE